MKILDTIEGCQIVFTDNQEIVFTAKAAIDTDGSGPLHGDPDAQRDTSLHHKGKPLNADVDQYIVLPPQIIAGVPGIVLGCQVYVENQSNHRAADAVVGDIGPHPKIGEISVALARALGVNPSPVSGGEDRHVIRYCVNPGVPAVVGDTEYELQPYHG